MSKPKRPSASVVVVLSPVGPMSVIFAFVTTAPEESRTVPPKLPFTDDSCAIRAVVVKSPTNATVIIAKSFFITSLLSDLKNSCIYLWRTEKRGKQNSLRLHKKHSYCALCLPISKSFVICNLHLFTNVMDTYSHRLGGIWLWNFIYITYRHLPAENRTVL